MPTQPLSPENQTLLSTISVTTGVAGVLMLDVLFPDASVALGLIAIVSGVLVLARRGSGRSRVAALAGIVLGIILMAVIVIVVTTST